MNAAGRESDNETRLVLEGSYTPGDYFEGPVSLRGAGYTLTIDDGSIVATIDLPDPHVGQALRPEIEQAIGRVFDAQQVMTCRPHERTRLGMTRHHPDGRKDVWVLAESIIAITSVHPIDFRVTNAEGQITCDSRAERLDARRQFREQCVRHAGDPTLSKLLASLTRSVDDPPNALVHLYEVRDALKDHFDGEQEARPRLGITRADWSYLGKISNDEPVREGRHRGLHCELRPASEDELERARSIARQMIRAYTDHLDRSNPGAETTE
ncbi:hypothetical protein [Tautonia rosea]|uniref:hypothetical protein n=1 Tax=Tautonia rosea TaxID=2728037 RepID=UPI0014755525|nr:hypothetical protein [Tautonia rosea]